MMLTRKTSFKSLTKTPKGGMHLVIRAQRPRVIRKIDTNLSSTGPKEAVFQATRDLGKKKKGASTSLSSGQGKDGELLEVLLKMKSKEEPLIRKDDKKVQALFLF